MALDLSILYRGELSGCNYSCDYCPFAKRVDKSEHLRVDKAQVERFVDWIGKRDDDRLGVFFTPWGEALIRSWYQEALVSLSNMPQVQRVAIQTNLSCKLDWIHAADRCALGLWCTYHPSQVKRERFLMRCRQLNDMGIRYSVGVVGLREHFKEIEAMRAALAPDVYLWINAYKSDPAYYRKDEVDRLASIDPLFEINNHRHASRGRPCGAGQTAIAVNGEGDFQRCHFIKQRLGNLYEPGWESTLIPRNCSNDTCGCHIGYVHLKGLQLNQVFGQGLLDRSLHHPPTREQATKILARTRVATNNVHGACCK